LGATILKGLNRLMNEIYKRCQPKEKHEINEANEEYNSLLEAISQAQREWHEARIMFNQVNEPELIDHAIYTVEAAEKKYTYLIKKAKEMGYQDIGNNLAGKENNTINFKGR